MGEKRNFNSGFKDELKTVQGELRKKLRVAIKRMQEEDEGTPEAEQHEWSSERPENQKQWWWTSTASSFRSETVTSYKYPAVPLNNQLDWTHNATALYKKEKSSRPP